MNKLTFVRRLAAALVGVVALLQVGLVLAQPSPAGPRPTIMRSGTELRAMVTPEFAGKPQEELRAFARKLQQDFTAKGMQVTRVVVVNLANDQIVGNYDSGAL